MFGKGRHGIGKESDHIVETDPAEADLGLELSSRWCQDHDPLLGQQHGTRVLGEPSFETDVYRSPKMRRREVLGRAGVEYDRTFELLGGELGESDRDRRRSFVEQ